MARPARLLSSITVSWKLTGIVLGAAATVMALRLLPANPTSVPGRDGVTSLLWPLCPVLLAAMVPRTASSLQRAHELLSVHPVSTLRITPVLVILICAAAASVLAPKGHTEVVGRNFAFLIGISLISACAVSSAFSWCATIFLPLAMWLLGTSRDGPKAWAVLLSPSGSQAAFAVAIVVLVAGVIGFLAIPRPVTQ